MSGSKDFETWWDAYPRKIGKAAARRKWETLRKSKALPTIEDLLAATERYKASWNVQRGYVCHPITWLNQGRWEDVYDDENDELAEVFNMEEWRSRSAHPSSHAAGRG